MSGVTNRAGDVQKSLESKCTCLLPTKIIMPTGKIYDCPGVQVQIVLVGFSDQFHNSYPALGSREAGVAGLAEPNRAQGIKC